MKRLIYTGILMLFTIVMYAQEKTGGYQVLTGYEADFFNEPYNRNFHMGNVGFGYKGDLTAIYGKLNLGYLNSPSQSYSNQTQFELDYWQSLNKSKATSFWLNYAYSPSELFPKHRIIFEAWQSLGAGFLVSGGVNHYRFTETNATFLNVGLEKYMGRYWVEGKTYFYLKEPNVTMSYALTGRVFFKDVNFLQVGFAMGSAQDEPFLIESDLDVLFSYSGHIRYVTNTFNDKLRIYTGFTYLYEEYQMDMWRNRFSIGIGLTYNL
jgi:YaiO family outer membrane protein